MVRLYSHRRHRWRAGRYPLDDLVGRLDFRVDLSHCTHGRVLHVSRPGGGRIFDHDNREAAVGRVANGDFDATARDDAGDHQRADPQVVQDVVQIGAIEHAPAGLAQDDLVALWGDLVQNLGFLRARRVMDPQALVLQTAIAAVARERLNTGVN